MRFVIWQQALLEISFVGFLLAYVLGVYKATAGYKNARTILLRLIMATIAGSIVWLCAGYVLFFIATTGVADEGYPYWKIEDVYNSTLGFPFSIHTWEFLHSLFADRSSLQYWVAALIPATLLVIGALVIAIDRVLAGSVLAVEKHKRGYVTLVTGAAVAALAILLWPQPLRNPNMADVPIPDGAVAVEYSSMNSNPKWTTTTFLYGQSPADNLLYYKSALEATGWNLVDGTVYKEYPISGTATFSKNNSTLAVMTLDGAPGYVALMLRDSTPSQVGQTQ